MKHDQRGVPNNHAVGGSSKSGGKEAYNLGICPLRAGKLSSARSRLYRSQFLRRQIRFKKGKNKIKGKLSPRSTQIPPFCSSQISIFCQSLLKCCQNLRNRIDMLLNLPKCWPNCGRSLPKFVQFLRKLRKRIRLQQVAVPRNILKLCTRRMRVLSAHATALSLRSRSRRGAALVRRTTCPHAPGLCPDIGRLWQSWAV